MLKKEDSISRENYNYIFKCKNCTNLIKAKPYFLLRHSGLCRSCCMKKPPFFHTFTKFVNTTKYENHTNEFTFEDFLEFTKIKKCYYCYSEIPWVEYHYSNSKYTKGGYFLDRKNNDLGYSKDNCVVCCTRCNRAKSNKFTYEEWYGMTEYFRKNEKIT